ncbi:MAG TPA: hypothetical protein VFI91_12260 [Longimicrobiaceae bacterium]|nr:hypothetical protein [Longimicrobiaceae bacterium]
MATALDTPSPIRGRSLAQIIDLAELSDEARAVSERPDAVSAYVPMLVDAELYTDAIGLLAHLLPPREGVWWAWVCARRAAGDEPLPSEQAALDAAERWIKEPTEPHRRAAMAIAEELDFSTPAACAALAAFFSGGSIAPPGSPEVPPGEFMTAQAIAGSIVLAAVATEPEKAEEKFQNYVAQGMEVVKRLNLWSTGAAKGA